MKTMMLVGRTGCGKTMLIRAVQGKSLVCQKTLAVRYEGPFVDTPGEYLENRQLYTALMATSLRCDTVGFVQDATDVNSIFPPGFGAMFNKPIIGIVTKVDAEDVNVSRAEKFLGWAGAEKIVRSSSIENTGIELLRSYLDLECENKQE